MISSTLGNGLKPVFKNYLRGKNFLTYWFQTLVNLSIPPTIMSCLFLDHAPVNLLPSFLFSATSPIPISISTYTIPCLLFLFPKSSLNTLILQHSSLNYYNRKHTDEEEWTLFFFLTSLIDNTAGRLGEKNKRNNHKMLLCNFWVHVCLF